jgi:phosphatidylserine/phosphatidylglycerophosphate/cardiolipin synthase-like enzyme
MDLLTAKVTLLPNTKYAKYNMAKFLNTRKAVSEIEDLIKNADQKLVLISPYLKISKDFKELLEYRNRKDRITTVIFGKQELNPDEMRFLQGLRFIILKYNEDLHAKCYLNDSRMIITSLNLYQFSMANNKEMGILIDRAEPNDIQLFDDALKEVEFLDQTSQRFEFGPAKVALTKQQDEQRSGFCIRTGQPIPFDIEKPMSYEAFKKWDEFRDPDYAEKFCHFSGDPSHGETSMRQPILRKHWKKAKEVHRL